MSEIDPHDARPSVPAAISAPLSWPVQQAPQAGYGYLTDQRPASGAVLAVAWISAVLTLGYMLPWAIAATRGRSNQAAIGLVDLFLGWSLIGWIVALVMACQSHAIVGQLPVVNVLVAQQFPQAPQGYPAPVAGPPAGWYPSPSGAGQQYWDGIAWTGHRAP
ncbi:superinfection immunity protein [Pengzhenrongella frigida]|uniref:Superinfection immunity protein n=1 Tax=Pengzhenrongella frigida TaxID=1259133 RepID=A0A4Q5N1K0_9MICO|nr:superinfection immunity protein [Cellulomonas sp. HLT2-17]RYV51960.1 superinfection immunity protein [Cellulomonas sp. HLT2-17]